jgi:phage/plasmid-like protein (TIGR03299 family)
MSAGNINSMFSVRENAWHDPDGKFTVGEYPGSWHEARVLAGLDWDPIASPVFDQDFEERDGLLVPSGFRKIEGFYQIKRSDNNHRLAIKQDSYTLITNTDMGEIIEAVLGQANVKWETAGVLNDGKQVWVLVKLDEPVVIPGDFTPSYPYLAITNHHDGSGACKLRATLVRIVCQNTFSLAEAEGARTGLEFSFSHTKNWRDRIAEAKRAVSGARDEMAKLVEIHGELLQTKITPKIRDQFVNEFVPMPPAGAVSDRVIKNVDEARALIRKVLGSPTTAPVADTAYGLVQAAGEYLDHLRSYNNSGTYLSRTLLRNEAGKSKAVKLVRDLVKENA